MPQASSSVGPASAHVAAMVESWMRGDRVTAEEMLRRHPGLDPESAIRLVYEEICLRRDAGLEAATSEVLARYPRWRDELEVLLACDRLLRPTVFPEPGEALGPFRLLAELGRGASGRTFLAVEPALADRPVVLKVVPADHDEHLALARLQHTHIVPLYSEQSFTDRGLRALCMPYLGGASLSRILDGLSRTPLRARTGRHVLEEVDRGAPGVAPPAPADGPFRRYLEQASYVQAVCWIAACLADALHYAHARGLVHMDIKPSNVLIAGDGQPMLLDFHLARGPVRSGDVIVDRLGGTPGWMSPEQESAMADARQGRPVGRGVDARSDLYAVGLLVREALGGGGGAGAGRRGDARGGLPEHPEISVGLADVLAKCLDPDPSGRYPDAMSLADDLRRHLSDLPLVGVPNRSVVERLRKWRRRRPGILGRGLAWTSTLAALGIAGVLAGAAYRGRVREARVGLEDGRRLIDSGRFAEAVRPLRRALERADPLPAAEGLTRGLRGELRRARRGELAGELHGLADRIRFRYDVAPAPPAEAERLAGQCRRIWDGREELVRPAGGPLDPESERRIRTDLLDIASARAALVAGLRRDDPAATRRDALRVLDEAERLLGPDLALTLRRREIEDPDGRETRDASADPPPRSAREHVALGRHSLRLGEFDRADGEFRRALELSPQDFWPNFYQGYCALRLGHFEDAAGAFRVCIALSPSSAPCYFNRALAYEALGRADLAYRDDSRALELDPSLADARLNRGVLAYKAGRPVEAIADLRRALEGATGPREAGRIHYNLALACLAAGERRSALAHAEKAEASGIAEASPLRARLRE